jgi:hypothetical protein
MPNLIICHRRAVFGQLYIFPSADMRMISHQSAHNQSNHAIDGVYVSAMIIYRRHPSTTHIKPPQ